MGRDKGGGVRGRKWEKIREQSRRAAVPQWVWGRVEHAGGHRWPAHLGCLQILQHKVPELGWGVQQQELEASRGNAGRLSRFSTGDREGSWQRCAEKGHCPTCVPTFVFLVYLLPYSALLSFWKYLFIWPCQVLVVVCSSSIFVEASSIFSCDMQTLGCSTWDLVPWPGIKPGLPTLGAWSLSHWTTGEVPQPSFFSQPPPILTQGGLNLAGTQEHGKTEPLYLRLPHLFMSPAWLRSWAKSWLTAALGDPTMKWRTT